MGASGLIPPALDFTFNRADDVQGSLEFELTKSTFLKGLFGYERLSDLGTPGDNKDAQLIYGRAAMNQILGRYFSFSVRYHYNQSRYLDGSGREIPGIPRHSGDARLLFIHPAGIQAGLVESYIGTMSLDDENKAKQKGYLKTDFYVQKEFFGKRFLLLAAINNVFNKGYRTFENPIVSYEGVALPAKGRTYVLRGEYRF